MRQTAIDSHIVKFSGVYSPAEIGEAIGFSPEEVVRRRQEIFDTVALTNGERRAKLIFQLDEITAEMHGRYRTANDENLARLGNTAAGAIGRVLGELRALEKDAREDEAAREESVGRLLASMVDRALQRAVGELRVRHPEIDSGVLGGLVEAHLVEVAREVDAG